MKSIFFPGLLFLRLCGDRRRPDVTDTTIAPEVYFPGWQGYVDLTPASIHSFCMLCLLSHVACRKRASWADRFTSPVRCWSFGPAQSIPMVWYLGDVSWQFRVSIHLHKEDGCQPTRERFGFFCLAVSACGKRRKYLL